MNNKIGPTPGQWFVLRELNVASGQRTVASCGGYTSSRNQAATHAENVANALLIAAAPELLAACQVALNYGIIGGLPTDVNVQLVGAINKARGGS